MFQIQTFKPSISYYFHSIRVTVLHHRLVTLQESLIYGQQVEQQVEQHAQRKSQGPVKAQ